MNLQNFFTILKGGKGSGNHGHAGRPGKRGGSAPKGAGDSFQPSPPPPSEDTASQARSKILNLKYELDTKILSLRKKMDEAERAIGSLDFTDPKLDKKIAEFMGKLEKADDDIVSVTEEYTEKMRKILEVKDPAKLKLQIGDFVGKVDEVKTGVKEFGKLVSQKVVVDDKIQVEETRYRSFYSNDSNTLNMTADTERRAVIHELGHWLENTNPGVGQKARDFLERRTRNENEKKLSEVTGNPSFDDWETTKRDRFIDPYIGKQYKEKDGTVKSTEILAMGLEMMYTEPGTVASYDPDYFDFLYNTVRGQ